VADFAVKTKGVRDLRRDLRGTDRAANREMGRVLRAAAGRVATEAAATAPRRTGALAASYRPYVRGAAAGVRSRLVYAPIIEYGGTIRPRGYDITFPRREIVSRAAAREADRVVEELAVGIERVAAEHGWRR
jgi:hypothetical protein